MYGSYWRLLSGSMVCLLVLIVKRVNDTTETADNAFRCFMLKKSQWKRRGREESCDERYHEEKDDCEVNEPYITVISVHLCPTHFIGLSSAVICLGREPEMSPT